MIITLSPLSTNGGALQPHKGDATENLEALSSACQIVNKRLMTCLQPARKNKQIRAHAIHATFFKLSVESHHAALECNKNQNI
jgi:hypothetical protein